MPNLKEDDTPGDDDIVITEQQPGAAAPPPAGDEDPRARAEDQDDAAAEAAATNDEERAAIRERRRIEKQERRERREKAIARDKLELDFLRQRNDALERRLNGVEQSTTQIHLGALDGAINKAVNEARMAEQVIAKAVSAGNGEDVTQAMRYRDAAVARANQLAAQKAAHQQAARPAPPAEGVPDSAVLAHARDFMAENKWYRPDGRDEDSAIVLAIDNTLVAEGFDPKTEEYWDELRTRAARRLPERFARASAPPPSAPRGGPELGSGREHAPASTRREVYISPERKQALVEAGVWDDPVLRMKYVKRYAEYDRAKRG